jgi:hypothetical protein
MVQETALKLKLKDIMVPIPHLHPRLPPQISQ